MLITLWEFWKPLEELSKIKTYLRKRILFVIKQKEKVGILVNFFSKLLERRGTCENLPGFCKFFFSGIGR